MVNTATKLITTILLYMVQRNEKESPLTQSAIDFETEIIRDGHHIAS